ncbi:GPP34 family phosphoprotein [Streptomyces sp. ISL-1]|uniref:GOLPH3/VPS74 family protein n=1 Tax=Streptomyces sp. ISL-1 TaxID=2817657 RepID=UPI001BEA8D11|nr:GPP34 family phosphoprotein [Streptomyces sp. ISL-1]MBT2392601.1 GPP34 family phosphoprotein [Streptomyces sp. ISL-1]
METTLGEQIMLLSLDDTTGAPHLQAQSEYMISSASVLELALAARVRMDGDHLVATDPTPLGIPVLDETLKRIAGQDKREDAQAWIFRLKKEAVEGARLGLLDKGVIREERARRWGIFPTNRYPEADGTVEQEVRRKLTAAVLEGQEPDARTAALLVLLHSGGLHKLVFAEADQAAVDKRVAELTEGHWAEPAMKQLVDSVFVALTAFSASTAVGVTNTGI